MKIFSYSFVWVIVACGAAVLLFIVGNLAVLGLHRYPAEPRKYLADSDPELGKRALIVYGCGGCHVIPGIPNATGRVGPRLDGIAYQIYVGGILSNTPDNMVKWIMDPQDVSPKTAMPDLGVSEAEARHMTAYLFSMDDGWLPRWLTATW